MAEEEVKETEEVEEMEEESSSSTNNSKIKLILCGVALFLLGAAAGCFWMTWNV